MNSGILVSVLIPSLRDCIPQIDAVKKIARDRYECEILTCGYDHDVEGVTKVKDPGTGSAQAFNELYRASKGDYIITLTGSVMPPVNMFDIIDQLVKASEQSDFVVSSLRSAGVCYVIEEACVNAGLKYRDATILRWPVASSRTLDKYFDGVIFNEQFHHHYIDSWFGLYCALLGRPTGEHPSLWISDVPHTSVMRYDDHDRKVLIELARRFKEFGTYNFNPFS